MGRLSGHAPMYHELDLPVLKVLCLTIRVPRQLRWVRSHLAKGSSVRVMH